MQLTIVGCSGSASGPESPASCYLVQAMFEGRTFSLVLDLGPGAFGALYRHLDPRLIDAIGISHLHPDHCLDLCAFYVGATYSPTAPWPRIPVFGPTGTAARIARAYEVEPVGAAESGSPIGERFDYRDWTAEQTVGPFTIRTTRVDHPVEAYAIRVTEGLTGAVLTFSGDTGPCDALVDLARDSDLLLVEAAFMDADDNPRGLHLSGPQAAAAGRDADVGRVVLTHIPPWHDSDAVLAEAIAHSTQPIEIARSGRTFAVGEGS